MGSGGGNNNSTPQVVAPAAPAPQSEKYYNNGVLQSERKYDPSYGGYVDNTYQTPDQQKIQSQANGFISNLVGQLPNTVNMSPDALQKGVDAYTQPQYNALDKVYNQAVGSATNNAAGNGVQNSVGFNDYVDKQLTQQKAQNSADIAASGEQMRYQLPSMALQPYADAFNIYNAASNGQQAQQYSSLNPSATGSNAASNFVANNYQNQLNRYNSSLAGRTSNGFLSRFGF